MKKALLAAGLAASTLVMTAPAAHADTPICVTRKEFKRVTIQSAGQKPGMTIHQVHQIFDTHGVLDSATSSSDGTKIVQRKYRFCGYTWDEGRVYVDYVRHEFGHPMRAYAKDWYINR